MDYVVVALIGGLVGTGELISRYRDAPTAALKTLPASGYILINAAASLAALGLIRAFDWNFGQTSGSDGALALQMLVAGFGAIAFFRSSLFLIRVGDSDVGVGPSGFLQILLSSADRAVDRKRASARATNIAELMRGVSFAEAVEALPTYCLALMQNVPADEQENLARDVRELTQAQMPDEIKVLNLGLRLMNVVGPETLEAAVKSLGAAIATTAAPGQPAPEAPDSRPGGGSLAGIPPAPPDQ